MTQRYDHAERKKAVRHGRERGAKFYIAHEELEAAGFGEGEVFYRCHGFKRSENAGSVIVSLYRRRT